MDFIGLWKVHSIASYTDDGMVFMPVEDYLNAPIPSYITDAESVEGEMADRRKNASAILKICDDGMIYNLMPIPEGVPQEEINLSILNYNTNLQPIAMSITTARSPSAMMPAANPIKKRVKKLRIPYLPYSDITAILN